MKSKILQLCLIICTGFNVNAQKFVSVMQQNFIVHSPGNMLVNSNSNSRNIVTVDFPPNTTGYIYRVSATLKPPANGETKQLYEMLKSIAPTSIVMETALAEYLVNHTDGAAVDAFTFNTVNDANYFLNKQDNYCHWWRRDMGIVSTCYATSRYRLRDCFLVSGTTIWLTV
jgi:hypothetical protein